MVITRQVVLLADVLVILHETVEAIALKKRSESVQRIITKADEQWCCAWFRDTNIVIYTFYFVFLQFFSN